MHDDEMTHHGESLWECFEREVLGDKAIRLGLEKTGFTINRFHFFPAPISAPSRESVLEHGTLTACRGLFSGVDPDKLPNEKTIGDLIYSYKLKAFEFFDLVRQGRRIAEGHVHPTTAELKREVIRPGWWDRLASIDVRAGTFEEFHPTGGLSREVRKRYYGNESPPLTRPPFCFSDIKIWERKDWDRLRAAYAEKTNGRAAKRDLGGRPPKYDWERFWMEVARRAAVDKRLPRQAKLVAEMLQWCQNEWGEEPAESTVKRKLATLYAAIARSKEGTSGS